MADTPRKTKANGHIIQADWNQTDPLKMDYIHNKPEIPSVEGLASIDYVDNKQIKIVNRAGGTYTQQVRFGDLTWECSDKTFEGMLGRTASVPLPSQDKTIMYTVTLKNLPELLIIPEFINGYGGGIGIVNSDADYLCDCFAGGCYTNQNSTGHTKVLLCPTDIYNSIWRLGTTAQKNALAALQSATITGPFEVVFGESSRCVFDPYNESNVKATAVIQHYQDVIVEYSYEQYEGDDEAKGPVHSIDLHSDRELHYDYPVTELTINSLHKCFSNNINQQWIVSFIAGDIDPIVIVPESVNNKPIKWINGKPQFRSNKKYMLTFKEITDTIYIETKLLSEDKICDQWIFCPYDNKSEGAIYGDITLSSLSLYDIIQNLKINEMFEIMGGTITLVANQAIHPDYEAAQGNITIPDAPTIYISNCVSLKIWKIRKAGSLTDLEVHILGTFIPQNGDQLPATGSCTNSMVYLVLSEYLSKCISGGGISGHNLIKYSNII